MCDFLQFSNVEIEGRAVKTLAWFLVIRTAEMRNEVFIH